MVVVVEPEAEEVELAAVAEEAIEDEEEACRGAR